jgi:hypothetical protein
VVSADASPAGVGQNTVDMLSRLRTSRRPAWLERLRRFWAPEPAPDHPLTRAERVSRPESRADDAARIAGDRLGSGEPD